MANRSFNRRQSLEKEVKDLYCKVSIGSSGAPTLVAANNYGILSIARNSTGDYSLILEDKYSSLKFFEGALLKSSAEDIRIQIKSEDVNVTKAINFFTLTGASPADPSSGSILVLKIEVKNTTVV
jgi:hypothetical protein